MKVTGYQLRKAIQRHELRRDALATEFRASLVAYPGEEQEMQPLQIAEALKIEETIIAKLQTAQAEYNQHVYQGGVSLTEAIKLVGSASRLEKMWSETMKWRRDPGTMFGFRSKDDLVQKPRLHISTVIDKMTEAANYAGDLRATIAIANAQAFDVTWLEDSWLQ